MKTRHIVSAALLLFGLSAAFSVSAQAQMLAPGVNVPINVNAGAVVQHDIIDNQLQTQSPWLNRPMTESDSGQNAGGSVINFTDIEGEIDRTPQIGPLTMPR